MSTKDYDANVKIAVTLRTARAAMGINQQDLADKLGIPKSTLARMETLEMQPRADIYMEALKFFKDSGVELDAIYGDDVLVRITPKSLANAKKLLDDESKRRSDRKVIRVKKLDSAPIDE